MGMMGKMGDMYRLQRDAKKLKKELAAMHIWSESNGVKVTVNGEQLIVKTEVTEMAPDDKEKLGKAFMDATNKAMKKAQQVSAEKMKSVMGGLQGLMGS